MIRKVRKPTPPRYEMHTKDLSEVYDGPCSYYEVTQVDTRERREQDYTVSFPKGKPPYICSHPQGREVSPDGALGRRILRAIYQHQVVYS